MRMKISSLYSCRMSAFRREKTNKHVILMSHGEVYLQQRQKHTKNIPQIPWGINCSCAQLCVSPTPMLNYQETDISNIILRIRIEVSTLLRRYHVPLGSHFPTFWRITVPSMSRCPSTPNDKETNIFSNTTGRTSNLARKLNIVQYSELTWKYVQTKPQLLLLTCYATIPLGDKYKFLW
jgi:hypothetical protein